MAGATPMEVIVADFPKEGLAREALQALGRAKREGAVEVKDAALLTRGEDQQLHISETADKGFREGALVGGVAGAAVGLLAGPIGWAALGGAAIGGLSAKLRDGGFPDERLRRLGKTVRHGTATIVAVTPKPSAQELERFFEEMGVMVTKEEVAPDLAKELDRYAARAQKKPHLY